MGQPPGPQERSCMRRGRKVNKHGTAENLILQVFGVHFHALFCFSARAPAWHLCLRRIWALHLIVEGAGMFALCTLSDFLGLYHASYAIAGY